MKGIAFPGGKASRGRSCWVYWGFTENRLSTRSSFAHQPSSFSLSSWCFLHTQHISVDQFTSPAEFVLWPTWYLTFLREPALSLCLFQLILALPAQVSRTGACCWEDANCCLQHTLSCPPVLWQLLNYSVPFYNCKMQILSDFSEIPRGLQPFCWTASLSTVCNLPAGEN